MDIELARTFLEIVSTGSFIRAAERLNVAQTTVSARVRTLEQLLGRPLFVRNKGGASLTAAGEQFLRHAPMFVQLWQRTRQQVAVPAGHRAVLTVGSELTLAQPLLLDWVRWIRQSLPDIALRVHVDVPRDLINQVASGMVDAAIMYAPQHRPGLEIDLLMEEKLVLATSDPAMGLKKTSYVHTDWGPDFALHRDMNFPDVEPDLSFDFGPLALSYVLASGGCGYFRMSAVKPHLAAGQLHLVPGMPQYSYPVYMVRSANADEGVLGPALAGLRAISEGNV
ncbi:LysR family transcriptional regulator [Sinorhizobium medicae]|uniref:Transcriptional regulator, LysR family n=1 Tax=Sinorhizobium medicae (strain WSM419) TaxID=366394 RepID=A6UKG3_SINMW|nr:LysR family transcriptional regulator [Sinorhizobium medicae]ABR64143.1 transcriptional regulator, LysR family [Sinorhizobium medicae WSM419]MBO1944522.1 LysR family transcriptional regulator [Sinorhizobium medicae]MBO1959959.1 LysR family transcriptional regulator [Sinorhizobium medicae]MDX0404684.1 LysR family transcriptional regulator [Sinorhizobium medicae]MDX0411675.1 LysR family transcriptional regulator [Sinorhizobium medicae]